METKIIFDLGGVLLDWDPRYLYREVFSDQEEMEYFLAEICSPSWNAQMDRDKPFQQAVSELAQLHPHYQEQIQAYHSRWAEMVAGEFPATVEILDDLKASGYPLAALSNWSAETFPLVQEDYDFLGWFNPLVLSGQVGVAKPDPGIYQHLLRETGWLASACLFIDDSLENIQEASRQGFQTIHFKSPGQLRKALEKKGLL